MVRTPPRSTLTYPHFPYPSLFRSSLVADWRKTADRAGFDPGTRLALVREATANAASATGSAEHAMAAKRAVAHAADKLGERQSVFSVAALQDRKSTRLNSSH